MLDRTKPGFCPSVPINSAAPLRGRFSPAWCELQSIAAVRSYEIFKFGLALQS